MAKVEEKESYLYNQQLNNYVNNPMPRSGDVIEGFFNERNMVKEMAIKKVNKTLCAMLGVAIICAFISYYFSMTSALELNSLSRKITALNDENADLQNSLDEMKSFNNVDFKMSQFNVLQKPEQVIEVEAVYESKAPVFKKNNDSKFNWAIGY